MKKTFIIFITCVLLFATACSGSNGTDSEQDNTTTEVSDSGIHISNNTTNNSHNGQTSHEESRPDTDDEIIENAIALPLNTEMQCKLESFDSVNIYKITLPNEGLVELVIDIYRDELGNYGEYSLEFNSADLYNTDGLLWMSSFAGERTDVTAFRLRLSAGVYYLTVEGDEYHFSEEPCTLYVKYADENEIQNIEKEWNDTYETANVISVGEKITGCLNVSLHDKESYYSFSKPSQHDTDVYCFTLTEEKVLKLEFECIGGVNVNRYGIYGDFGNYSESVYKWDKYETFITKTKRFAPGTYYIEICGEAEDIALDYYFRIIEVE